MLKSLILTAVVGCVLAVFFSPAHGADPSSKNATSHGYNHSHNHSHPQGPKPSKAFKGKFHLNNNTIMHIHRDENGQWFTGVEKPSNATTDKKTKSVLNRSHHSSGGFVQMQPQNNFASMMPLLMSMMGNGGGAGRQDAGGSGNNNAMLAAMISAMGQSQPTQQIVSSGRGGSGS
ncbi:uncharacterized protein LOC129581853 [Paramacrobiotus metropolitanus]|uniref:uncharacterized protein LOC129581853 n=1 Tax=Paramacrobiotus metropolitanus TaxID=2943436 RepID=UPI002445C3BB|nr:uncharacterized protein LOC129581853 [Paramacrobiotus metropolitanus]